MGPRLELVDDPDDFLIAAGDLLAAAPVEATVVATAAASAQREGPGAPAASFRRWWLVVRDQAGVVVGAGMRTNSVAPHPPYLLGMPEESARDLARLLHGRGERVEAVNGALPAAEVFAAETARLTGSSVRVAEHTRVHELAQLQEPAPRPPGRLRAARDDDLDLAVAWFTAFAAEAAEQAGRARPHPGPEDGDALRQLVAARRIWLWEDAEGRVVHLTAARPATFGVARVGPVYTPGEARGRGYAGAAVFAVSRLLLDEGARVCLFTDLANPVSNALYERLGFVPVADQANLVIEPRHAPSGQ